MPLRLMVFDMAGTTVRDGGQVAGAFTAVLGRHGIALEAEALAAVRGASKREAVRRFLPEGADLDWRAAEVYEEFREELKRRYTAEGVEEVPGAAEVFRTVRADGVRVALITGFDRDITSLLLEALGWSNDVVDAVVTGDDVRAGRPAPYLIFHAMEATNVTAVADVAAVGDTALDLETGHNAGVGWNIGVLSGAHDRERLARGPHTAILGSVREVPGFLGRARLKEP